ncbi:hypothetical protein V2P20_16480 [Methylobacter sp. Wu1]|uniref:hypothetical protein n=1 Tax=Methylobacter sp. Wu1 TaxID=3119359 RepID=UPI002F945E23
MFNNKLINSINLMISISTLMLHFLIKELSSSLKHTKIRPLNRLPLPEKQDEGV